MRMFTDDPYLTALADVYDESVSAVLLTDTDFRPVYFNRAAGLYYGQICELDALKNRMTPQSVAEARAALKTADAVRVEINRGNCFSSVVFTKVYNRDGCVAALRVQAEAEAAYERTLVDRTAVESLMRREMLAPCADMLRSVREMYETGKGEKTTLKRMEQDALSCLRFAAKLADVISLPETSTPERICVFSFVARFADEYGLDVSGQAGMDNVFVAADAERLYRMLCVSVQELMSLPSTGKYRTKPSTHITQDECDVHILLKRTRVRDDTGEHNALTDIAAARLGGRIERIKPSESGGTAQILLSVAKATVLLPEYRLSDSRETEFAALGGIMGDILKTILYA